MKTWHWIFIIVAVICVAIISSVSYINKSETDTRIMYSGIVDSMATAHYGEMDSLNFRYSKMENEYHNLVSERDSLKVQLTNSTKSNKVMWRTVYKDSVREVIVENSESVTIYEKTIQALRDSLATHTAKQDGVEVKYVKEIVHDTVFVSHTETDTMKVEQKTEVNKEGKFGIYAGADAKYGQGGFGWDAEAGLMYYIAGPLYVKGGVEYSGNLKGLAGIGINLRF